MRDRLKPAGSLVDILFWPFLFAFVLLSVVLALRWFSSVEIEHSLLDVLDYPSLAAAGLFQFLVTVTIIFAWQSNLRFHGLADIGFWPSAIMVGINAIGKYTPGKVWGILARGTALLRISSDRNVVIQATLAEQIALLHSGAVVGGVAWCFNQGKLRLGLALLSVAALSVVAVARSAGLITRFWSRLRRANERAEVRSDPAFGKSYVVVFALLCLVWVLSAAVLHFCIAAISRDLAVGFWETQFVTVMAYLAGFMAFFSVAGLGVREGVMVAMLSQYTELSVAVYISVVHRLVSLLLDVVLGCVALVRGRSVLQRS